ncbi:MAG: M48 family metallopeptidase [Planctomycetaceae bacterium]|jgi:Zn-dependent protease with chaperone function|nr:M48 family metallopeptidase [Planctomycetaceae bacterium]
MDFFQHQVQAKKRTGLLLVLYVLGVIGLIAVPVVIIGIAYFSSGAENTDPESFALLISGIAGFMLLIILGGSLFKTAQLATGGGKNVAESLGGRLILPNTSDLAERRLYNVVEEMSLASGIPVPAIYIMDNEQSINAFAAGFSPNEAVIGCNRGTVELLSRDELQGVIAHEFSHILNGDMRMNLRLIGILFGLQVLALIGYFMLRIAPYMMGSSSSRNSKEGNAGTGIGLVLLGGGLVMMLIGYIGVFFSAVIQAAVSRQREFLADASAVQFTRNPAGIAGALKKIGCPNIGSAMHSPAAAEASHLFFGNACGLFSFGQLLATHPPLPIRIKRIDPSFDGKFPKSIQPVNLGYENNNVSRNNVSRQGACSLTGSPAILPSVLSTASEPLTAKATFYAVLLDGKAEIRQQQITAVASMETGYLVKTTLQVFDEIQNLDNAAKIPLVMRITSALRTLTVPQYKQFSKAVDALIAADNKMDLFEYTLKAVLLRDLDIYFGLAKQLSVRYTALPQVQNEVAAVLSFLAYSGHNDSAEAQAAFAAAFQSFDTSAGGAMLPPNEVNVVVFDKSLRELAQTAPMLKKQIYEAFIVCVQYDGIITPKEAELLRAVAAMLAIPMPVF